jgi:uncharacterized protein YggE
MNSISRRGRLLAVALVAVLAIAAVACRPQTSVNVQPNDSQNGIAVTGTGTTNVTPDLAVLNLGASVTAKTVADAREQAAQSMQAVIDAVKSKGVADKDVQTTSFNISPQYNYTQDKGQEIVGYQVTNLVTVKVRNLDTVPDILDAAAQAGGNDVRVNSVQFTVENPDKYLDQARTDALNNAKAHAQTLADAAGVKLGAPRSISESSNTPGPVFMAAPAASDSGTRTPVSAGETQLTVTVSVVYSIQ